MGFFSKMFYTSPARGEWSSITLNIAQGLEKSSEEWFDGCVQTLGDESINVVNTSLSGDADLAIKAYQLLLASNYISSNRYIAPEDVKDFSSLLYENVCGAQFPDMLVFFERYTGADEITLARFADDVTKFIKDSENPFPGVLMVTESIIKLALKNSLIISSQFNDTSKVNELRGYIYD